MTYEEQVPILRHMDQRFDDLVRLLDEKLGGVDRDMDVIRSDVNSSHEKLRDHDRRLDRLEQSEANEHAVTEALQRIADERQRSVALLIALVGLIATLAGTAGALAATYIL